MGEPGSVLTRGVANIALITRSFLLLVSLAATLGGCWRSAALQTSDAQPLRTLNENEKAVLIAAARELMVEAIDPVPVCVSIMDTVQHYPLDRTVITALGPRAKSWRECPKTYASMVYNPTVQRPPGYIDPYVLDFMFPVGTADGVSVEAQMWQGTGFTRYHCDVTGPVEKRLARCKRTGQGVS